MRIIGGIRPTGNRIRASLFNILEHRFGGNFNGLRVLDLFAGTGALGLEALSRGAKTVVFIEESYEGCGLIHTNLEVLGLTNASCILRRDATQLGSVDTMAPFNLVFADPPYRRGMGERACIASLAGGWLHTDATFILEDAADVAVNLPERFIMDDERYYGITAIRFYILAQ